MSIDTARWQDAQASEQRYWNDIDLAELLRDLKTALPVDMVVLALHGDAERLGLARDPARILKDGAIRANDVPLVRVLLGEFAKTSLRLRRVLRADAASSTEDPTPMAPPKSRARKKESA